MARFACNNLLTGLIADLGEIALLPDDVTDGMLNAQADVIMEAQKGTARSMLGDGGMIGNAIQKNAVKKTKDGRELLLTFGGKVRGARRPKAGNAIAEIAFVNEFGKDKQAARPFIMTANEKSADEAAEKAAKVYDGYLKSKGF